MNQHVCPNNALPFSTSPEPNVPRYSSDWEEWTRAVCALNDAFRFAFTNEELYLSPDVLKRDIETQSFLLERVRFYQNFNAANDPNCNHTRGYIRHEGELYVWAIYGLTLDGNELSSNPLDLNLRQRLIMIMTEDEWWEDLPENEESL